MVDQALHDWIAYPAVVLMQVHVVVGGQEANRTTMVGPQLVYDYSPMNDGRCVQYLREAKPANKTTIAEKR